MTNRLFVCFKQWTMNLRYSSKRDSEIYKITKMLARKIYLYLQTNWLRHRFLCPEPSRICVKNHSKENSTVRRLSENSFFSIFPLPTRKYRKWNTSLIRFPSLPSNCICQFDCRVAAINSCQITVALWSLKNVLHNWNKILAWHKSLEQCIILMRLIFHFVRKIFLKFSNVVQCRITMNFLVQTNW